MIWPFVVVSLIVLLFLVYLVISNKVDIVADAKDAWKWLSVQAMTLNAGFIASWQLIPDDLKSAFPSWFMSAVAIALLIVALIGRFVKQS